ncbi:protein-L-isoaspartate(D-aspartate) O-methyltransferase [Accumulibacter sp.]|uniref:protein-L-isoaspartate(D-aspartate) O-methyltransferase n=1 Tax=Accumulibacter sp. TaxID=2053492 RepID=UPI0025FDF45C|nr:protein-L-isoaspartate(D-aspartate) O-methyltransferase [Accumulibacter sp.]MCM8614178.1 protein-L-isoaspartate(D-aspartate) O-methyltransferase [Accumulibacter sp.]MCM8637945.1 protein-L-isoaspartate(D-aspartate) O-methyltransferase [Accumulibacter sp.]MCM8641414.1 protein-L-isoaspartate(D-aspartate) O-methyltransferase [Accumulibacter sp.]
MPAASDPPPDARTPPTARPPGHLRLAMGLLPALLGATVVEPSAAADSAAPYATARQRMVEQQLIADWRGISKPEVLRAMATVPRHEFVPPEIRQSAYEDRPLPIGHGQTISQPYIVAFMTEQLAPQPSDRVLEIGTGSGYQAAILASLVREVYSIEIVEPLAKRAAGDLARLGYGNVRVRHGDGYQGWPEAAPFDSIIVTCAPDHVPQPLVDQLREGGRMVIPVGDFGDQNLFLLRKHGGRLERERILPVRFVPMTGTAENGRR